MTVFAYSTADEAIDCSDMSALKRPVLAQLIARLSAHDVVRMPTLSDAGKDPIDVFNTVALCLERQIKLVILELSDSDITSSPELLKIITAFSDQQHQSIIERLTKTQ